MKKEFNRKPFDRIMSFSLSILLILSLFAIIPASASYDYSSAYKSGKYYEKLKEYKLTGDMRQDVVSIALTQVGYHEGNSDSEMHGNNGSGSKNFVEYNRLYGKLDNGEGNGTSYGYSWCCSFVSWCLRQANVPTSLVTTEVSCPRMITWLKANSKYVTRASGHTPIAGDIIFFKSSTSKQTASHIGIVLGVSGNLVYTVEGNANNNVAKRSYSLTDTYIVGYGVPNYTVKENAEYSFVTDTTETSLGKYRITASSLNVRKGAGASYDIRGTLSNGDVVEVFETSGNWGRIFYNGDTGWISMNYAEHIGAPSPKKYYVTANSLTVRSGAGASYDPIGYLSNGDEVEISETSGNWGKIEFNGSAGWISMNYVSTDKPTTTPSTTPSTSTPSTSQNTPQTTPQTTPSTTPNVPGSETLIDSATPNGTGAEPPATSEGGSATDSSSNNTTATPDGTSTDAVLPDGSTSADDTSTPTAGTGDGTGSPSDTDTADTGCGSVMRSSVILVTLVVALAAVITVMTRRRSEESR